MTNYAKGYRVERRAGQLYLERGYHTIIYSRGSHGPADFVAVGYDHNAFVQAKSTVRNRPSYKAEIEEFEAWPVPERDIKEFLIWLKNKRQWVIVPC